MILLLIRYDKITVIIVPQGVARVSLLTSGAAGTSQRVCSVRHAPSLVSSPPPLCFLCLPYFIVSRLGKVCEAKDHRPSAN